LKKDYLKPSLGIKKTNGGGKIIIKNMKGIILAGGVGSRLFPVTKAISKHFLPIYDKPMIYYPLSVLMLAGIREILIISNPENINLYQKLLGNGEQIGIEIKYKEQDEPRGIADAFIIGEDFIGEESVCLILGDNVFYGQNFVPVLQEALSLKEGALIFGYYVNNPKEFGIAELDKDENVVSLQEKPEKPLSNYAVTGLYFYDNTIIQKAKKISPSPRGELEITDINQEYLKEGKLKIEILTRGFAWLDTGTYEGLASASDFVKIIQKRTGLYVACIEEIAYKKGWIDKEKLQFLADEQAKTEYGKYLKFLLSESD
jgi:glucose-1-phosphate thymidylyltransferase